MLLHNIITLLFFFLNSVFNLEVSTPKKKVVCYLFSTAATNPESLNANLCTHVNYAFVNVQENGTLGYYSKVTDLEKDQLSFVIRCNSQPHHRRSEHHYDRKRHLNEYVFVKAGKFIFPSLEYCSYICSSALTNTLGVLDLLQKRDFCQLLMTAYNMYTRVYQMKNTNPQLKLLFSVVASSADVFSSVAADSGKRRHFLDSSIEYLKTYNYDGIDIDWEFPNAKDSENYVSLLKELRSAFEENQWLLTVAARPIPTAGYNVTEIMKYVDFINVMCYNYFGSWSAHTGQNSPLYASSLDSAYEKKYLNVAMSGRNWLAAGATREKIVIGVPFYGRSFTLSDPDNRGLHAPVTGAGTTPTPTYSQICKNYNNWTTVWDDEQKNYYKYLDNQWLGFDEERSMTEKAKYIVSENFAGVMVWHLGGDDVLGECGKQQVLLNLLNTEITKTSKNVVDS